MQDLKFRFEWCGQPAKLYFVEDHGDHAKPIQQCYSREAEGMEPELWKALTAATEQTTSAAAEPETVVDTFNTWPGNRKSRRQAAAAG